VTAGYSGTPLAKKLGIKEGSRVAILDAPNGFEIPALPPGVRVFRSPKEADVILLFSTSFDVLRKKFVAAMKMMPASTGMLWVAWPKRASKMPTDLDENLIRDYGLDQGLVDTKVCAVDSVWSGLRFNRRRS
jgi:hypothetical protein